MDASKVIFVISKLPESGVLKKNGAPLNVGESFTQADINSEAVSYENTDNSKTEDSFSYSVSIDGKAVDEATTESPASFTIAIKPLCEYYVDETLFNSIGSGTAEDPYRICHVSQLADIGTNCNADDAVSCAFHFKL